MSKHVQASIHRGHSGVAGDSPITWQERGPGIALGSASVLLGFIQCVGDSFEASDLTRPMERTHLSSLSRSASTLKGGAALK
jgi:hypothetical protein